MGLFGHGKEEEAWMTATAEVLDADRSSFARTTGSDAVVANTSFSWKLRLLVTPEGGAPFEAKAKYRLVQTQSVRVGQTLPVRYRPSDPSDVEVDDSPEAMRDMQIARVVEGNDRLAGLTIGGQSLADALREGMDDPKALRERLNHDIAAGAFQVPGGMPGATPPAAPPPPASEDPIARLERLADLRDRGALTPEEFEEQKRRILDGG